MQLLGPFRPMSTVPAVAELFKATEADRQAVQEKSAVEMDALFVQAQGAS